MSNAEISKPSNMEVSKKSQVSKAIAMGSYFMSGVLAYVGRVFLVDGAY
jgi:hypothetical protein